MKQLFTSESRYGRTSRQNLRPDQRCGALDAILAQDPCARVACET